MAGTPFRQPIRLLDPMSDLNEKKGRRGGSGPQFFLFTETWIGAEIVRQLIKVFDKFEWIEWQIFHIHGWL
jgi:hypothetical protein